MRARKSSDSSPDYSGWEGLSSKLVTLPSSRFYFVTTMLSSALVAYLVSDSKLALAIVVSLMLAFALCVVVMHRKEDHDQEEQDCSTESSDDDRTTEEIGKADEGFRFREHDGHGPPSPSGVRTPLESEKGGSANHHPR